MSVHIGLLRHFPVEEAFPTGWRTSAELIAWRERYDQAAAVVGPAELGNIAWQSCLSSDLPRALVTAGEVFSGRFEATSLLREPEFLPFQTGNLRLPALAWRWILRLSWMTGHSSQRACRDDFQRRVLAVADRLGTADCDTLVVSHAGMMFYLSAELRRRGFIGPKLRMPNYATVYLYRRTP